MLYINCITQIYDFKKIQSLTTKYLRVIQFDKSFNTPWIRNIFPETVEVIMFDQKSRFNFNLSACNLPPNLKQIHFGKYFNKKINDLPDSVEVIYFYKSSDFNKVIRRYPANLRQIYFGPAVYLESVLNLPDGVNFIHFTAASRFDQYIDKYPADLDELHFGEAFNQDLAPLAKISLKTLKFCSQSAFNQPLCALNALETIVFGKYFNRPIDVLGGSALKSIKFYSKSLFNQPIGAISATLEVIALGKHFDHEIAGEFCIKWPRGC